MRGGEYEQRGDYHRHLDRRWSYYPVYQEKMRFLDRYLSQIPRQARILDLGCGEGLVVEKYRNLGYNISGIDLHYESEFVDRGNITELELPSGSVNVVLCLDVIEHLFFPDQNRALSEVYRILKPGGKFLMTVPNLAHFSSRLAFLLTGQLLRTSSIERHPGDRPLSEYRKLLKNNFEIKKVRGIFPTFPISSLLTLAFPAAMLPWHRFLNTVAAYPPWCFLSLFECEKKNGPANLEQLEFAGKGSLQDERGA